MKFRFLEISPPNGSHYLISDQRELARFNDAETGFTVLRFKCSKLLHLTRKVTGHRHLNYIGEEIARRRQSRPVESSTGFGRVGRQNQGTQNISQKITQINFPTHAKTNLASPNYYPS